jgi:hypothetical protein
MVVKKLDAKAVERRPKNMQQRKPELFGAIVQGTE